MSRTTSTQLTPAGLPGTTPPAGAPRRNALVRAMRAAAKELFGLAEPPTEAPAGRRVARAAYSGAETTRFNTDWRTSNEAANDDIRGSMLTLRARGRYLSRNNPYIQRFRQLLGANVVGPDGVGHQAQVRFRNPDGSLGELDEATNNIIEEAWREYCRGPVTVDGRQSMHAFQCLQLDTCGIDGESFTRLLVGRQFRHGLGLQPIDPDLVAENFDWQGPREEFEVRLGVEVDLLGKPVGYYVWDWPRYTPGSKGRGLQRLPADQLLHHFRAQRPHQTRGVSWIAPVLVEIDDLNGYDEAVIKGARAGANQLMILQWKDPSMAPVPDTKSESVRTPVNMDLAPATATEIDPGLEAIPFDPKQPSGVYADFTKTVLRRIASGLGLEYSSLSNDLREVNYSSAKIGLQAEREMWKMLQAWWVESFLQPIYERWLEAALLSGALRLPNPDWRAYSAVAWQPRRWPWIEPQREIGAARDMIDLGLTSRQRVLAEQSNGEFRKLVEELAQEQELAAEKGVSVTPSKGAAAPAPEPVDEDEPDPREDEDDEPAEEAEDDEPARGGRRGARAAVQANRVAALARNGHGGR